MPKFFKEILAYSRTERAGILVLSVICVALIIIPSFLPEKKFSETEFAELKLRVDEFEKSINEQIEQQGKKGDAFVFDPNTADSTDFIRLGFSPAQTAVITRYRTRGGVFNTPEDFGRIYVVSNSVFSLLKPYIKIHKKTVAAPIKSIPLNTADTTMLKSLQGIGSYFARKIVERRDKLGGFVNIEQLMEINGITDEHIKQFENLLTIDLKVIQKIKINNAKASELRKHPYIDFQAVNGIIKLRKAKQKINSIEELINENIFTKKQASKIKPYLDFDD